MNEFLVILALLASRVTAFSSSSNTLPSSSGRKQSSEIVLHAKNYRSTVDHTPGADLFNNGPSYVPSGLTKEQYAKIKKEEQQELQKKDFASWGPRFSKTERPDGDWMVVPSLWTSGFGSVKEKKPSPSYANAKQENLINKRGILPALQLKEVLPLYALASFLLEIFFNAIYAFHKKEVTSFIVIALTKLKRGNDALLLSSSLLAKLTASKLVLAALLMKPLELMIEKCNRKFLWSPRRTMIYGSIGSVGILSLWNVLIMGLKMFF